MSNINGKKVAAGLGIAVTAFGAGATQVSADDVQATVSTQAEIQANTTKASDVSVQDAQNDVNQAQDVYDQTESDLDKTTSDVANVDKTISDTEKAITNGNNDVSQKQDTVSDAKQAVDQAQSAITDKQSSVTEAQEGVNDAQSVADTKQNDVNTAQQAVTDAANQVDTAKQDEAAAQQEVNDDQYKINHQAETVKQDQQKVDDLTNQQAQAEQEVKTTSNTMDSAKQAESTTQTAADEANKANQTAQSDKAAKETIVDSAQQTVNSDQAKVTQAQNDLTFAQAQQEEASKKVSDAQNVLNNTPEKIVSDPIAVPADNDGGEGGPWGRLADENMIGLEKQLPDKLVKPKNVEQTENNDGSYGWYGYESSRDTTAKIVNGQPTREQQLDLANYALTLVNSFRKQNGLPPLVMTNESFEAALKEMEARMAKGITTDHFLDGSYWNSKLGRDVQPVQNLGFGEMNTMLQAKVSILNSLTTMAWQDGSNGWLHRAGMLQPEYNEGTPVLFGAYFENGQFIFDAYPILSTEAEKLDMSSIATPFVNTNDGFITNPAYIAAQNNLAAAQQSYNQAAANTQTKATTLAQLKSKLEQAQTVLANAQQAYATASTTADATQQKSNQANADLTGAKQAVQKATADYQVAQTTLAQVTQQLTSAKEQLRIDSDSTLLDHALKVAKAKLVNATAILHTKQTALEAAKQVLAEKQAALDSAQADQKSKQGVLDQAKAELADAQKALATAKLNLQKAQSDLVKAQDNVKDLEKKLVNAKALKENGPQVIKDLQSKLDAAKQDLMNKQNILTIAQAEAKIKAEQQAKEEAQKVAEKQAKEAIARKQTALKTAREHGVVASYVDADGRTVYVNAQGQEIAKPVSGLVASVSDNGSISFNSINFKNTDQALKQLDKVNADAVSARLPETGEKETASLSMIGMILLTIVGYFMPRRSKKQF